MELRVLLSKAGEHWSAYILPGVEIAREIESWASDMEEEEVRKKAVALFPKATVIVSPKFEELLDRFSQGDVVCDINVEDEK